MIDTLIDLWISYQNFTLIVMGLYVLYWILDWAGEGPIRRKPE